MSSVNKLRMRSVKRLKKRSVVKQRQCVTLYKVRSALQSMSRSVRLSIKSVALLSMSWSAPQVNNKKLEATYISYLFRVY